MTSPVRVSVLMTAASLAALLAGCATINPSASPSRTASTASTTPLVGAPEPTLVTPTIPGAVALSPATEPTGTPPATPGGTQTVPASAMSKLQPAFTGYYATLDQVLQGGGASSATNAMKAVMTGTALDNATKLAAQYKSKGYKQTGLTRVESFSLGEVNAGGASATADFCTNSSAVVVKDAKGAVVPPADPAKRAMGGTATMAYIDGLWRVSSLDGLTPIDACP